MNGGIEQPLRAGLRIDLAQVRPKIIYHIIALRGVGPMLDESVVTASELMTRDVAVVNPETSLLEAVRLMASRRISGMPVVDEAGNVVGVISEGDLLRWHEGYSEKQARWLDMLAEGFEPASSFLQEIYAEHHKVKAVMSRGVTTIGEEMPAREIASLMHSKDIKRVPVLRDGKLVGIVARSDLVRALAQKLGEKPPAPAPIAESVNEALRRRREEAAAKTPARR
jgi:CBS domain-containing protein